MALKFKPMAKRVRMITGDGEYLPEMDHVRSNPKKLFVVIGPFDDPTDKPDLQDMLKVVCRGYNLEPR